MRSLQAAILCATMVIVLAGCSTAPLTPTATDGRSVTFSLNPYARIPGHLVLTTFDGHAVANGTLYRGGVVFRLPTDQRWAPYTGQCLQVRSITGQQIGVAGIDNAGFVLLDWQSSMRTTYEGGYLQQQRTRLTAQINNDSALYQNAQAWMQRNSALYVNGVCQTPARSAQPNDACETPAVAQNIAQNRCAEHVGCAVFGATVGSKSGDLKELTEFAATNLCDAHFMSKRGEAYTSETFGEAIGSVIATKLTEAALEGAGFSESDAYKYSRAGIVALEFMTCMSRETNGCAAKYQAWLNGPQNAHEACVAAVGVLQNTPQKIEQERNLLQGVNNDVATLRQQTSYPRGPGPHIASCRTQ